MREEYTVDLKAMGRMFEKNKKKTEFKYLVCYKGEKAQGRREVRRNKEIESIEDIADIEKEICKSNGLDDVIVTNIQRFPI